MYKILIVVNVGIDEDNGQNEISTLNEGQNWSGCKKVVASAS